MATQIIHVVLECKLLDVNYKYEKEFQRDFLREFENYEKKKPFVIFLSSKTNFTATENFLMIKGFSIIKIKKKKLYKNNQKVNRIE